MSTYLIDDSFGLSEVTTRMLNEACEEFIQRSKIFDEIAVVQICTDRHLLHVYDYSYRNLAHLDAINAKEVKALLPFVDKITMSGATFQQQKELILMLSVRCLRICFY